MTVLQSKININFRFFKFRWHNLDKNASMKQLQEFRKYKAVFSIYNEYVHTIIMLYIVFFFILNNNLHKWTWHEIETSWGTRQFKIKLNFFNNPSTILNVNTFGPHKVFRTPSVTGLKALSIGLNNIDSLWKAKINLTWLLLLIVLNPQFNTAHVPEVYFFQQKKILVSY